MSAPIFNIGIATDPVCADWKAIDDSLRYLTGKRIAAGNTIMLHDITPWGSTKMALLWGTANGHAVGFTQAELHLQLNSATAIVADYRQFEMLDALVVFHNQATPALDQISRLRAEIGITARDVNQEIADLIAYAQQQKIPTRIVPYDSASDTNQASYPIRAIEHGQSDRYGVNLRTGSFYAPHAHRSAAQDWLFHAVGRCYQNLIVPDEYKLDTLEFNAGWWNYSMHHNAHN